MGTVCVGTVCVGTVCVGWGTGVNSTGSGGLISAGSAHYIWLTNKDP